MSNDNIEAKKEELCERKQELSIEELKQINGGGSDPLYVADGVAVKTDLKYLDPAIIESMQVLKDASAGATYGARAAN